MFTQLLTGNPQSKVGAWPSPSSDVSGAGPVLPQESNTLVRSLAGPTAPEQVVLMSRNNHHRSQPGVKLPEDLWAPLFLLGRGHWEGTEVSQEAPVLTDCVLMAPGVHLLSRLCTYGLGADSSRLPAKCRCSTEPACSRGAHHQGQTGSHTGPCKPRDRGSGFLPPASSSTAQGTPGNTGAVGGASSEGGRTSITGKSWGKSGRVSGNGTQRTERASPQRAGESGLGPRRESGHGSQAYGGGGLGEPGREELKVAHVHSIVYSVLCLSHRNP